MFSSHAILKATRREVLSREHNRKNDLAIASLPMNSLALGSRDSAAYEAVIGPSLLWHDMVARAAVKQDSKQADSEGGEVLGADELRSVLYSNNLLLKPKYRNNITKKVIESSRQNHTEYIKQISG